MAILDITGPLVGAATASSGLILVYLGAASASFATYQPQEKKSVIDKYKKRGNFAFGSLLISVFAALFALLADWMDSPGLAVGAFIFLLFSLLGVVITAYLSILEIS